jgi:hypothetical protein
MTSPALQEELEQILLRQSESWNQTAGRPETTLLRLAILREIIRNIHARKSHFLATGRKTISQGLDQRETFLNELRHRTQLEGSLKEYLLGNVSVPGQPRILSDELLASIGKEKLTRHDRQWEAALAAEAAVLGWSFWSLEVWVEITQVEQWNLKLNELLWPRGLVLFVESGAATRVSELLWQGRWILTLPAGVHPSEEFKLTDGPWPGTPNQPPSPPTWKLLFSQGAQ